MTEPVSIDDRSIEKIVRGIRGSGGNSSSSAPSSSGLSNMIPESIFGGATATVKNFAQGAGDILDKWRASNSNFGLSMNGDAGQLTASITKTRMSFEEFTDAIEYGKTGFASIGGTMTESGKIFLKVSTELSDFDGNNLQLMGYQQGEYNKLLSITMASSRTLNFYNAEDQKKARESTVALATEMDKMAKLTGVSRKEQEENLIRVQNDMKFKAKLLQLEAQGVDTTQLQEGYKNALAAGTGEFFQQQVTGGEKTQAAIDQGMIMGATLVDKTNQSIQQMTSSNLEDRKKGLDNLTLTQEETKARVLSEQTWLNLAATQNSELSTHLQELMLKSSVTGGDATVKYARDNGITIAEAVNARLETIKKDQKMQNVEGTQITGAAVTQALITTQTSVLDLQKKYGEFQESMNISMARQLDKMNVIEKLNAMRAEKDGKAFADSLAGLGPALDKINTDLKNGQVTKNIVEDVTKLFKAGIEAALSTTANVIDMGANAVGVKIEPTAADTRTDKPPGHIKQGRAGGSKEATGQWFENFGSGTDMTLHNMEAIVPKEKMPEFISDMQKQLMGKTSPNDSFAQLENISKSNLAKLESSDMYKKNNPEPPVTQPPKPEENKPTIETGTVSLKDINDQLTKLNTVMVKLVTNTNEMVDNSSKQYRATKQLSPNINAR